MNLDVSAPESADFGIIPDGSSVSENGNWPYEQK